MHVVSDTSPLSCLASIQRLDLIQQQFGAVHVPASVAKEVMRHPSIRARGNEKGSVHVFMIFSKKLPPVVGAPVGGREFLVPSSWLARCVGLRPRGAYLPARSPYRTESAPEGGPAVAKALA